MKLDPSLLALLLGIATLANALVEAIIKPLWEKFSLDNFWLLYVAWVIAGVITFLANVNLFEGIILSPLAGLILTAVIAGRASNILYDLTDKPDNLIAVFNALEPDEPTYSLDEVKESVDELVG
jgi:uncharacterized membrane protein HdeD (DUF308 family)